MQCPPNVSPADLRHACNYLLIPFTSATVRCDDLAKLLHELSNAGAQAQCEKYIDQLVMPSMATAALVGQSWIFDTPFILNDVLHCSLASESVTWLC